MALSVGCCLESDAILRRKGPKRVAVVEIMTSINAGNSRQMSEGPAGLA
jgi:hypothetical protein